MKKTTTIIFGLIGLIFGLVFSSTKIQGAEIAGYPPNIATYTKMPIFSDYFYMTTGKIRVDQDMKTLIVYVPNFDFIVTSGGTGTEQNVTFFDVNNNVISRVPVFGRLVGWFTYNIPDESVKFEYQVLNQGSVPTNYVSEWNNHSYISYGDNLDVYQSAWNDGYNDGKSDGINIGRIDGYNDGKSDGINIGRIDGYNDGKSDGINDVYYDGFGGFLNPDTNQPYDETKSFPYGKGYQDGILSTESGGLWNVLFSALLAPFQVLGIELLPGITIGMIVAVPLVFGLLAWILSAGKSKK